MCRLKEHGRDIGERSKRRKTKSVRKSMGEDDDKGKGKKKKDKNKSGEKGGRSGDGGEDAGSESTSMVPESLGTGGSVAAATRAVKGRPDHNAAGRPSSDGPQPRPDTPPTPNGRFS